MKEKNKIAVIGIGNILMSDDGAGIFALRILKERYHIPEDVELIDGGTKGLELLPFVEGKEKILFIDAVNFGKPPGFVGHLTKDEIPDYFATKLSVHQIALPDLIGAGRLMGVLAEEIHLVGIQPQSIDTGYGLTGEVEENLERLVDASVEILRQWGVKLTEKNDRVSYYTVMKG
ncbi:MAG TPA: hydrogenase maturation protease [Nitrospirae bacterium]|nr:hydrogenase maturation protease [Nitrospirota bacterium]